MIKQERYEEAVALYRESLAADLHFKSLEMLGECLVHLGRLREAFVPLAAATTLNNGVRAPALLAEVFLKLGQRHDAAALADVVLSRSATNRQALSVKKAVEEQAHE